MDKLDSPKRLKQSIIFGIAHEEHRRARIYLAISSSVFVFSLVGLILSIKYITSSFYESGFYQYLLIVFSGGGAALEYWKELLYSLIETMPIIGIIGFLIALGFFIWSGINTIINTRRFILLIN